VSLQFLFGVLILIIFALLLRSIQTNLTEAVATSIGDIIISESAESSNAAIAEVEAIRTQEFFKLFVTAIAVTGIFGVIISHVTLTPTRNAFEAQKRFIGNIAHELRTPLAIIKTNLEVLLLRMNPEREISHTIHESIEEIDRSSEIINNLVNFNDLVQHEQIRFDNVQLDIVVENALRQTKHLVGNKHIHIAVEKYGDYQTVWGNTTALEQVVINLLRNAINYTGKDGRITLHLEPDYAGYILLSVADNGGGIAQKDLLHVFEPFYRVDKARTRGSSGGSGLGLTIVNEIVKSHHGKISIKSAPRRGTTVTISLPCGTPPKSKNNNIKKDSSGTTENEVTLDFSNTRRFL
jgi:two-component system sensor histidine kinase ResE